MRIGLVPALVAACSLASGASPGWQSEATTRDATRVVADFDAVRYPGWGHGLSDGEHRRRVEQAARRQCGLATELATLAPEHAASPRLMERRWSLLMNTFGEVSAVLEETRATISAQRTDALVRRARILCAAAALRSPQIGADERFELVHAAISANPEQREWAAALLAPLALETTFNARRQLALIDLAIERYPNAFETARMRGHKNVLERLGETLELTFAVDGVEHDLRQYRGRKVVVAVWSDLDVALKDRPALERLSASGVDVVSVGYGPLAESIVPPRAPWPTFVDTRGLESWAWKLGVRWSSVYLVLDEGGRLSAATQALEPVALALAR